MAYSEACFKTYCCLSFFFNYLDRQAFANAYVAGLQEAVNLQGTDYNVLLAMTTAGYVLGQIPHGIVIQVVAPRIWFPSMVVVWAILTMVSAAAKSYVQLCVIRFFLGLVEASTYCGAIYCIGCWYKPREIAKRTALFTASGQAGSMFAGLMMTAIYKGMNGLAGLAGWQWVFIIDGIITLPIAIMGFLYFPDLPEKTKAPWLTSAEKQLALERLPPKREDGHNINPWSLAKRTFTMPALYILVPFAIVCSVLEAYSVQNLYLLWLKFQSSLGFFTQAQVNTYPLGIQAVGIVSNLLGAVYIDATGRRVPMGVVAVTLQLVATILLIIPNMPWAATMFAYYLAGSAYMVNSLLFGWANVICQRGGDDALRSIILTSMNAFSQIPYTFWGILLFPANKVPYWRDGYISMFVVMAIMLGLLWVVLWLDRRTAKEHPDAAAYDTAEVVVAVGGEKPQYIKSMPKVEFQRENSAV
ncbi:major facilitator superfamily domain-containing protein [Microdochium trichocladiopsis]|uniref:Major facilitator superfamily domain-containing protein n=1 Tax=Microdochium trichocladiopsis TaxID=1682393 RepID=A0A9P8Y432_9PEZI|nr:major facilitator superfamily domain-containing protein [Microdochium trichocladiopsis]KAH7027230.1 major facilitator superfamily domain-containing protein [Microdochium trichocladiopsis]